MHHPSPSSIERCITCGSTRDIISFLEKYPDVMDDQDEEGNAIFSRIARTHNIDLINWLLKKGIDLWATNKYGQTALHRAFVIRAGEVSALLYYYEKQIRGNPMEAKNDLEYTKVFLALPDPRIRDLNQEWHDNQVRIFNATMDELCRSGAKLPEATFNIAIERIDRLNREARSLSDSSSGSGASGGGSGSSADSEVRYRGSADEKESAPLLANTMFRNVAAAKLSGPPSDECDL